MEQRGNELSWIGSNKCQFIRRMDKVYPVISFRISISFDVDEREREKKVSLHEVHVDTDSSEARTR
jgi:hypothetical protein